MTTENKLIKHPALEGDIYELRFGPGTDTVHIHRVGWRLALCGCPLGELPKPDDLATRCNSCFALYPMEFKRL